MKLTETTREEMWARQHLSAADIDYTVWERDKSLLHQLSKMDRSCTFVVDVYKSCYAYASPNFVDLLGYDSRKIATLEKQGEADKLCISIHTVHIHRQNLLRKLGVQNSIEAIRSGQELGILG